MNLDIRLSIFCVTHFFYNPNPSLPPSRQKEVNNTVKSLFRKPRRDFILFTIGVLGDTACSFSPNSSIFFLLKIHFCCPLYFITPNVIILYLNSHFFVTLTTGISDRITLAPLLPFTKVILYALPFA